MEMQYLCGRCGFRTNRGADMQLHRCLKMRDSAGNTNMGVGNPDTSDAIEPQHYRQHPSGVDCIQITEHMNFPLGNVIKYVWRAGLKGEALEDLKKARWYLDREIARIEKAAEGTPNYMYGVTD